MNKAKLSAGKNLKIHRLIGVLLGMWECLLTMRQQIYLTSNFWFHNFEQLCQLVYLQYNNKPSCNCDSVTHVQIEYLERRFGKKTTLVQKKSMFQQVFQIGENYTDEIRLSVLKMDLEITFFGQFIETK